MTEHPDIIKLIARQLVLSRDPDQFITGTDRPIWTTYQREAECVWTALCEAGLAVSP